MAECEYCFCHDGEPHFEKCPYVNQSSEVRIDGLIPGTTLDNGRFQVGMALNHGGFGITYLCKDTKFNRRVVVKEFFPNKYSERNTTKSNLVKYNNIDDSALDLLWEQFIREYEIMVRAANPGIPAVYGFFESNNSGYIAMDFIEGVTFQKYLRKCKTTPHWWELRKKFFLPLMDIVDLVHRKGILHRDISLVNLMITKDEKIYLLDFGAARDFHVRDTVEQLRFANMLYAPIEQTHPEMGFKQGPWTDIFAMGTVFYSAITGHYPPTALERPQNAVETALAYIPDLPEAIDDALMKSLYYYPQHRYQQVSDFRNALMAYPDPQINSRWNADIKVKNLIKKIKNLTTNFNNYNQ